MLRINPGDVSNLEAFASLIVFWSSKLALTAAKDNIVHINVDLRDNEIGRMGDAEPVLSISETVSWSNVNWWTWNIGSIQNWVQWC